MTILRGNIMEDKYNVYKIDTGGRYASCYSGMSLVAAENADEANKIISKEIKEDVNNANDMWGYGMVDEYDIVENVYSNVKGIVLYGIYYRG